MTNFSVGDMIEYELSHERFKYGIVVDAIKIYSDGPIVTLGIYWLKWGDISYYFPGDFGHNLIIDKFEIIL